MEMHTEGLLKERKILISKIKDKKELRSLSDDFVFNILSDVIKKNNLILDYNLKSKSSRTVIKDVRKILHDIYGVFILDSRKRKELFFELKEEICRNKKISDKVLELHRNILLTHRSTKERLPYYGKIYKKIFSLDIDSILDLGSGLNIFSYPFIPNKKIEYIATELTDDDCNLIDDYFKLMECFGLRGGSLKGDLINLKYFPKTDACFIFKILDSLEELKRDMSRDLLGRIKSKYIIVSFPTKTLSGKVLSKKRLSWFNKIAKTYETFEVENEIFYIIKS